MIQVVDRDDNLIGHVDRSEIDYATQIYRISGLWLRNSQGQVLVAQRTKTKDKDPGKWGPAAAGTLDEGETYESNMHKEAKEELGLTNVQLKLGPKVFFETPRMSWCQWYSSLSDLREDEFILQPEEVDQVAWVDVDWLRKDLLANPDKYVPSMQFNLDTNEGQK